MIGFSSLSQAATFFLIENPLSPQSVDDEFDCEFRIDATTASGSEHPENLQPITNVSIAVTFDDTIIDFLGITQGSYPPGADFISSISENELTFSNSSGADGSRMEIGGLMATAHFRQIAEGVANIVWSSASYVAEIDGEPTEITPATIDNSVPTAIKEVSVSGQQDFDVGIKVNFSAVNAAGNTIARCYYATPPNPGGNAIGRYYEILTSPAMDFTASSITLSYTQEEFNDSGLSSKANIYIAWSSDNGENWHSVQSSVNALADEVTADNLDLEHLSIFALGGEGSLPVTLSYFAATTMQDGKVILRWTAETEVNNIGWNIYRSMDKTRSFKNIDFVHSTGNSAFPNDYQYVDKNAVSGITYFYYIEDVDIQGQRSKSIIVEATAKTALKAEIRPAEFQVFQNYPNPFNPATWIPYQLAEDAQVIIRIYNVTGQLIRTLELGNQNAGFYLSQEKAAYWNGKNDNGGHVAGGVYFYRIKIGKELTPIRKMVLLK
jgi:hypothetical protein